jgi:hypothetical protein
MPKNEIDLRTVKEAVNAILDHLMDDLRLESVPIRNEEDFYWDCSAEDLYNASKQPTELTVGRLTDDMDFARSIHRGQYADVSYSFVHLAPLLRYIGETIKK